MNRLLVKRCALVVLFLCSLHSARLLAQAPSRMSYQAEVRNNGNTLVVNQQVGMRISILQGNASGTVAYSETHTPTTNSNGLVSIEVGGGTPVTGTFSAINWGNGPYFLKSEIDPAGGSNYTISGVNQLLSVPYSFYSNNGVPTGGSDGQVLTNCNGTPVWTSGGQCPALVSALNCAGATNNGTLTAGVSASVVSSVIDYTGGNGGPFTAQTVSSTGVTGLTASLDAGTVVSGSGSVTYTITGTPSGSGTASFAISLGGQSCTLTRTVNLPAAVISTFSCSSAQNTGDLTSGVAASNVSSSVSYTGGNGGTYTSQSVSSTGVTGLTASLDAGTIAGGSGSVTYAITGTPSGSGTASFAISLGGQSCTLTRTVNLPAAVISTFSCSSAQNTGDLTSGVAASNVSSSVSYTGGNGGTYTAQSISSTGVTGLTASLDAGTVASGSGSVTYAITGTPSGSGTASFAISLGGQSCTLTRTVNLPAAVISTFSCSSAQNTGDLTLGVAASNVSSAISYTGGNGGTYPSQSVSSTGVTGLTAALSAGTLANGSGSVTYTLTGTPSGSGTASFAVSLGGQSCTLTRTVNLPAAVISTFSCSSAQNTGDLTSGVAASNVSSSVSYTGGNGGTYPSQSISSTGVTGLTAALSAGTLANGNGSVTYTLTGTPSGSGTASFAVSLGGQSCTLTRTVAAAIGSISALNCANATNNGQLIAATLASNVTSVVPYTGGNGGPFSAQSVSSTGVTGLTASLAAGNFASGSGNITYTITGTPSAAGTANFAIGVGGQSCTLSLTVGVGAGTITGLTCSMVTHNGTLTSGQAASNVTTVVPYTGGNGGTYDSQSVNSTGVTGLTAGLAAGNFASGNGNLTYTITGTPSGYGTATFAISIAGRTCTFTRNVLGGTSSACAGMATVTFTYKGAQVTYGTMVGANNTCWMDRNLGASQVATASNDANAHGDLFQWGRGADGHQTRTSATTSALSAGDQPGNGNFIVTSSTPFDWRSTQNNSLWQGTSGTNNPCPSGWRLPTDAELEAERISWSSSNTAGAFASPLKWTATGARSFSGSLGNAGSIGYYWSSSIDVTKAKYLLISGTQSYIASRERSYGHAVRCIRN